MTTTIELAGCDPGDDDARRWAAAMREQSFSTGQPVLYTGRAGAMPAEFRGWRTEPVTGDRQAIVIVRPDGEPPFEASVRPDEIRADTDSPDDPTFKAALEHAMVKHGEVMRRLAEHDTQPPKE